MAKTIYKIIVHIYYLVLLLIASLLLSIYIVLCTPFVFNKKLGILATSLISQVIWFICTKIFVNSFEIKLEANDLKKIKNNENVIIISNHIGAVDFMAINEISKRKNMLRHAKYMVKESIKYIPILGYMQFLGFPMLKRNYEKDKEEIKTWLNYFKKENVPVWFVIFPEGSRFTKAKKVQSQIYCKQKGVEVLENVLLPKVKGFDLSVTELKGYVKHVVDLTIMYEHNGKYEVPSLFSLLFKMPPGNFYINVKVHDLEDIDNPEEFVKQLFYEKDKIIQIWKNELKKEQ